ncbi:MAG: hypothetical protein QE271_11090 [Bacteriovoracaceae bacterium]|nr:hypothetical protein [Bacteriovoracaceae bacterium]
MKTKKFNFLLLVAFFTFSLETSCSEKKVATNVTNSVAAPAATPCTDPSKDPSLDLKKEKDKVDEFSLTKKNDAGCKLK